MHFTKKLICLLLCIAALALPLLPAADGMPMDILLP